MDQKVKKISKLRKVLLFNDSLEAILGMLGLFIALIEYDDYFSNLDGDKERFTISGSGQLMRYIVSCLTAISLGLAVRHAMLNY